jgi:F-type H+-transporting ATPase subunit b
MPSMRERSDTKKAEAEKERTGYEDKNKAIDEQRSALLDKAADEAKAERESLMDQAKTAAEGLRSSQADALREDQIRLGSEITLLAEKEVFAMARKTLTDLATVSLEERVGEVFTRRLRELDPRAKERLGAALQNSSQPALVRSAFDLPAGQKAALQDALNETFSAAVRIKFEDSQDAICGIEVTANGQKVAWSISSYLTGLSKKVMQGFTGRSISERFRNARRPFKSCERWLSLEAEATRHCGFCKRQNRRRCSRLTVSGVDLKTVQQPMGH